MMDFSLVFLYNENQAAVSATAVKNMEKGKLKSRRQT